MAPNLPFETQQIAPEEVESFAGYEQLQTQTSVTGKPLEFQEESPADLVTLGVPSVLASTVDTFGTSLGIIDENDVSEFLKRNAPRTSNYFERNREGVQLVGDLAFSLVPIGLFAKGIQGGAFVSRLLKAEENPVLRNIFTSGNKFAKQYRNLYRQDLKLAKSGTLGEAFKVGRRSMARKVKLTKGLDGVKTGLAVELGLFTTMNESEILYPTDFTLTEHLMFASLGITLPATFEYAFARRLVAKSAQRAAPKAYAALNREGLPIADTISRPGQRDLVITINALAADAAKSHIPTIRTSDSVYAGNLNSFRLGLLDRIKGFVRQLSQDNVPGVIKRGAIAPEGQLSLLSAADNDALSLLGVFGVRNVPGTRKELLDLSVIKNTRVAKMREEAAVKYNKLLEKLPPDSDKRLEIMRAYDEVLEEARVLDDAAFTVVTPKGDHIPLDDYNLLYVDDLSPLKTKISTTAATETDVKRFILRSLKSPEGGRPNSLAVDADFTIHISNIADTNLVFANKLNSLSPYQRSGLYTLMQKALEDAPVEAKFLTGSDPNFMKIDAILTLLERNPERMKNLTMGPEFNSDIKALELFGLDKKFKEYNRLYDQIERQTKGRTMSAESIRQQLNLPQHARGEISPLETLFAALRQSGKKDLSSFRNLDEFRQMVVNEVNHFADDAVQLAPNELRLRGKMLEQAKHGDSFLPNVLTLRRPIDKHQMSRDGIEDAVFRQFDITQAIDKALENGSKLVGPLSRTVANHGAYQQAKDVFGLNDAALMGSGTFNTSAFGSRSIPAMQAANILETLSEKESRTFLENLYQRPNKFADGASHGAVLQNLTKTNNIGDMELFSQYVSTRRHAWDLARDPVAQESGRFSFILRDTEFNQKKYQQLFGEQMPPNTLMPLVRKDGKYQPLELTNNAMQGVEVLRDLGVALRLEQNSLADMVGRPNLKLKEWWMPPINLRDKEVAFVMSPIPGGETQKRAIVARTPSELRKRLASEEVQVYIKEHDALVVTPDDFIRYANLQDEVFHEMLDATDWAIQLGKTGAGATAQIGVENGRQILGEAVTAIRNQVNSVTKRTMHVMFEPQINFARMMKKQLPTPNNQFSSVYDIYTNSIIGNRGLNRQGSLGKFYSSIESLYDDALLALYDRTAERGLIGTVKQHLQKGFGVTQRQHDKLVKQVGSFAPVEHTVEELGRRFNIRPPATMQKQLAAVNQITSALVLRMFELGHPLLNFSGVIATMPAVVQALGRYPHENTAEWIARTGAFGTPLKVGDDFIAKLSPVKMIAAAAHHPYTAQGKVDWEDMTKLGYMRQEVAEISRTITQPERGFTTNLGSQVVDAVSFMSDRSEELSRGWAHMAGVKLARESLGITDKRNIHSFAHKFANELIGDYRAVNRPQIFQGAVGLPLGLFQTYVWNYYQRLFSYIENRDFRSLATQIAMQASVFGAATVPGFKLYSDFFASTFDNTTTPIDALNNKLGPQAADWILNGTLSNIPKIFGSDGIALYSRGDVNFHRLPAFLNPTQAPIAQLAQRTFNTIGDTLDQFRSGGQFSLQQTAEIFATYSMNRPFARLMEIASGYAIDRRGQVINDEVRSGMSVAARVFGLRPMMEQKQIETSYRMRQTEFAQRELRTRTRKSLRSAIRGEVVDTQMIEQALFDYVEQGGNPRYFPQFLRDQFISAIEPKARLELERALKSGNLVDILRLYNAQTFDEVEP